MLTSLSSMMAAIACGSLDEAAVYAREQSQVADGRNRAPGMLVCPLCTTSARRFLPFGLFSRPNAMCPGCGSVERHRFLYLYLLRRTRLLYSRQRVLHAAPEPGLARHLRRVHGRAYLTVDRFDPSAGIRAPLHQLPLANASVDTVIASHVLEHVDDDASVITELARVIRPNGQALILVPYDPETVTQEDPTLTSPQQRMEAYGHPFHRRIYGNDLPARLERAGFLVTIVDSRQFLSGHERRKYRINRNVLFDCQRRQKKTTEHTL